MKLDLEAAERMQSRWRARLTEPLTPERARRLRWHLALIPVYAWLILAWSAYASDISAPGRLDRAGHIKGHDFVHFYVLGQIARDRAVADLYSFSAQAARTDRLVPQYEDRFLPVHAPQVALFFAPIASMPYERAVAIWLVISAVVYGACCLALFLALPELRACRATVAVLAVAFPAFYGLIAAGQTSAFALAWFTFGFFALKGGRPFLAGLALGALAYKPTLGIAFAAVFVFTRQSEVIAGAVISSVVQFGAAWAYLGFGALEAYAANFSTVAKFSPLLEAQPQLMHSLHAFFLILLPWPAVAWAAYVATAAIVVFLAIRTWSSPAPIEIRYSILIVATVLVDPHVYTYELVVLDVAFFLLAAWGLRTGGIGAKGWALLYLCYFLPALDALTTMTRVQLSVPALAALMALLVRHADVAEVPAAARGPA